MLNCENTKELLWAYCEGSLDSETSGRVKRHIAACASCAREHRAMAATLGGLKNLERIEPSDDFLGRVWQRIDEREAARGFLGLGIFLGWLRANRTVVVAGGLAFVMALVGVRYGLDGSRPPGAPGVHVAGERESAAPAGMRAESDYRDDYILRDIPETTPVVSGFDAGSQDTIETRFITRDVVPSVPYANEYIQPVVQPVADDGSAF
ncbi:MAG: zf-HC2 domain-containing protein [bacterium]|jgi:hypothetical protein